MAEQVVNMFYTKRGLPIVIVRPSIVTAASCEPFPGWVDSFNGLTGFVAEICRGAIKHQLADKNKLVDLIPVDLACNMIIAAAWSNATKG